MFVQLDDAETAQEMRAAIDKATYHNAYARHVLYDARRKRMTAEDTYTRLAYFALRGMIETQQALLESMQISPRPPVVLPKGSFIPD